MGLRLRAALLMCLAAAAAWSAAAAWESLKPKENYELPQELIAQTPAEPRDSSRLMVLDRENGNIEHRTFRDITEYLREGDTLVINDSKVIPARLFGAAEDKPDRMIEFLLLRNISGNTWESLARPGKKARIGRRFVFGDGILKCTVRL